MGIIFQHIQVEYFPATSGKLADGQVYVLKADPVQPSDGSVIRLCGMLFIDWLPWRYLLRMPDALPHHNTAEPGLEQMLLLQLPQMVESKQKGFL